MSNNWFWLYYRACFELQVAIAIIRVSEGFDSSEILGHSDDAQPDITNPADNHPVSTRTTATKIAGLLKLTWFNKTIRKDNVFRDGAGNKLSQHIVNRITRFKEKVDRGTIDIWWLYDDGGLTVLLPYIISKRSEWASCRLRIFCTVSNREAMNQHRNGMVELLLKLDIKYSDLTFVNERSRPPRSATRVWFNQIIRNFVREEYDPLGHYISENERQKFKVRTDRQLRLRELLLYHSSDAKLVVMTLPIHRRGAVSVPLYSAWLETLTANMPPFLLVRGNQSPVLTFFS